MSYSRVNIKDPVTRVGSEFRYKDLNCPGKIVWTVAFDDSTVALDSSFSLILDNAVINNPHFWF